MDEKGEAVYSMTEAPRDGTVVLLHRKKFSERVPAHVAGRWVLSKYSWSGGAWRTKPPNKSLGRALGQDVEFFGWSYIKEQ